MRRVWVQITLGVLVLTAGVLMLLEVADVEAPPLLQTVVLLGGAAVFGYVFFASRDDWWAALPSAALAGAAIVTVMDMSPAVGGRWAGAAMLGALGLGFWAAYLRDIRHWWAIIPGGVLATMAATIALTGAVEGPTTGAVFLLGAAATFALVAVLPGGAGRRWWAWIPAAVLTVAAVAVLLSAAEWVLLLNLAGPLAIMFAGAFLIWRALQRRSARSGKTSSPTPGLSS